MEIYYFMSDYIYEDGQWKSGNIYVNNGRFTMTWNNQNRAKEMNVQPFWIGPGKIYVDVEQPIYHQDNYVNVLQSYINRGCTLLLCQLPFESTFKFKEKFYNFKEKLSSQSPIDFMIVPRISALKLTIEQLKFFGKEKVPFILIDAASVKELKEVKWQWLQQIQSFSKTPIKLIPTNKPQIDKMWEKLHQKYNIDTINAPIDEKPLSKDILRLTGISPTKGEFLHQAWADYNLFDLSTRPEIDEETKFRYHKAIPEITVSNGNIVKSKNEVHFNSAQGVYRQVTIPKHFL